MTTFESESNANFMMSKKTAFDQYNWDLESLLQGKSLEDFFADWEGRVEVVIKAYDNGECFKTLKSFRNYLDVSEQLTLRSNRILNYVLNKQNENLSDGYILGWKQKLMYKCNYLQVALANFANSVITYKANIEEYLKENDLKKYQRLFFLIFRTKPHMLKKAESKVVATLSPIFSAPSDIYQVLAGADLKYNAVVDKKGKTHAIKDIGDISRFLKCSDRTLRKNTYISFASAFKQLENSFAQTLYAHYLANNLDAQIHHFKDYIAQTAFDDEINDEFIPFVYQSVHQYAASYQKYAKEMKKNYQYCLKLRKVEPWDTSYPLFSVNKKYTIEETKAIVKEALSPLGDEYLKNVQRAFDERWISWLPRPAKTTGAYSIGDTKGLDKFYILMNFDERIESVYTIAHELGHSMHSLAFNSQPVHAESEIFFAEISSITNEVLLSEYLLKKYKNDLKTTLHILQELIANFFATTLRQVVFSEVEYKANELINQKKPFNAQVLKNIYAQKIVEYYGYKPTYLTKLLKNKYLYLNLDHIFRISHFYYNVFYVYKYAVGQVAALINAKNILNQGSSAIERFQKFLASGNSLSPLATINLLGIDLTRDEPWQKVGEIMLGYIDQFIKLSRQYREKH